MSDVALQILYKAAEVLNSTQAGSEPHHTLEVLQRIQQIRPDALVISQDRQHLIKGLLTCCNKVATDVRPCRS